MGNRLYVGNLSFHTTEETLRTAFEEGGRKVVEVTLVTDRETGQPRGFGFVEMGSAQDAQAAIGTWNGRELDGRSLKVNEAQERTGGFGGGGGGGAAAVGEAVGASSSTIARAPPVDSCYKPGIMSKQDEVRARIIAAEAARAALINPTGVPKKKPRSNWAASPPVAPNSRRGPKK